MKVSDIYQDVYEITSFPDEARNFSRISDAVEVLNNKAQLDALLGYLVVTPTDDIIVLPFDVEVPLRVNIDNTPAFPRDKMYEFTMNGPGSNAELVDWSWLDKGGTPVFSQPVSPSALIATGSITDNAKEIRIYGRNTAGNPLAATIEVGGAASGAVFASIERVLKDATSSPVALKTSPALTVLSNYYAEEVEPMYRKIRISKTGATAYILFRARTFNVTSQDDFIPIRSKMGLIYMIRSLEAYRNDQPALGQSHEELAIKLATEEQNSANPFIEISGAIDAPSCRGLSYGRRDICTPADFWDDACMIFGPIGYNKILDRMTETSQMLANKANWSVMQSYVTLSTGSDKIITLPNEIEVPIKVAIDSNPTFSRNRYYEYTMNGPGKDAEIVGWSWVDRGAVAVPNQPDLPSKIQASGVAGDNGLTITIEGESEAGNLVSDVLTLGDATLSFSTNVYRKILFVIKPVTFGRVTLQTEDGSEILAIYGGFETYPQYRQIRLSKTSNNVSILYRMKSPVLHDIDDIIPVRSRMAFIHMMKANKAYRDGNVDMGQKYEEQSLKMANEEQASFDAFEDIAAKSEVQTIRDFNYTSRDSIIVSDVFDDFSQIFGPIGTDNLFDKMTETIEALSNKGQWDPLVGYVDINTDQYKHVTLPRYVETILALKECCGRSEFHSRWHEFHMDGSWVDCLPCGGWSDEGVVCTTRDMPYSVNLYAVAESPNDIGKFIQVFGYYRKQRVHVQNDDNTTTDGLMIPINDTGVVEVTDLIDRIDRIVKPETDGFISLRSTDSQGNNDVQIGFYYPNETIPSYRRIKLNKGCKRVRIMYRKRSYKISSLTDPIHLGSKLALLSMARSMKLMESGGDLALAGALENKAEQYLREEQQSQNPLEFPDLDWNLNYSRQMI